jgi:hypothetical protein
MAQFLLAVNILYQYYFNQNCNVPTFVFYVNMFDYTHSRVYK